METITCCVCGSSLATPVWALIKEDDYARRIPLAHHRSRWVVCRGCGLVFQNPRPDASQMAVLYSEGTYREWTQVPEAFFNYSLIRPQPVLEWLFKQRKIQALERDSSQSCCALDIGCGVGGSLALLRDRGWTTYGVEPDAQLARAGSERFKAPIAPVFMHDGVFPEANFNLMLSIHTFEHLLEPLEVARSAARRLSATEGFLCVVVPTYRRATHWAWEWMNTAHTYLFTHVSLGNLLKRAGFRIVAWHYPTRCNHPEQEPSELWLLAQAQDSDAAQLPLIRESVALVQRRMLEVPVRAAIAFGDHRARLLGRFVRRRVLRLGPTR